MTYSELAHAEWLVREAKKALTNGQHVEYAHLEHAQEIIRRVRLAQEYARLLGEERVERIDEAGESAFKDQA